MAPIERLNEARVRVAEFDRMDREGEFLTPDEVGPDEMLRVAMDSLWTAICSGDWDFACDSLIMLQRLHPIPKVGMDRCVSDYYSKGVERV